MDPVTAMAAATTAFKAVQRLVNAGRELEDVAGQLGKWYTAASDIANAEQEAKNPPFYKKLLYKGSVEEEALNATIAKQKLYEQETELRTMIMYRYGSNVYKEMIELRRKIRKQREQAVYNRRKMRQNIIEGVLVVLLISLSVGLIGWFIWLINNHSA